MIRLFLTVVLSLIAIECAHSSNAQGEQYTQKGPLRYTDEIVVQDNPHELVTYVNGKRPILQRLHKMPNTEVLRLIPELMKETFAEAKSVNDALYEFLRHKSGNKIIVPTGTTLYHLKNIYDGSSCFHASSPKEFVKKLKSDKIGEAQLSDMQLRYLVYQMIHTTFFLKLEAIRAQVVLLCNRPYYDYCENLLSRWDKPTLEDGIKTSVAIAVYQNTQRYFMPIFGDDIPEFMRQVPDMKDTPLYDVMFMDTARDEYFRQRPDVDRLKVLAQLCALHRAQRVNLAGFIDGQWEDYYKRLESGAATKAKKKKKGKKKNCKAGDGGPKATQMSRPLVQLTEAEIDIPDWMTSISGRLNEALFHLTFDEKKAFINAVNDAAVKNLMHVLDLSSEPVQKLIKELEDKFQKDIDEKTRIETEVIPGLKKQVAALEREKQSLSDKLEKVTTQLNESRAKNHSKQEELVNLQKANKDFEKQMAELRRQAKTDEEAKVGLQERLKTTEANLKMNKESAEEKRKKTVDHYETELQKKAQESQELRNKILTLEKDLTQHKKTAEQQGLEICKYQRETSALEDQAAVDAATIRELETQIHVLQEETTKKSNIAQAAVEKAAMVERENVVLIADIQKLNAACLEASISYQKLMTETKLALDRKDAEILASKDGQRFLEREADLRSQVAVNQRLQEVLESTKAQLAAAQQDNEAWRLAYERLANQHSATGSPKE